MSTGPSKPDDVSESPDTRLQAPSGAAVGDDDGLDPEERAILAFEKKWWKYPGAKEAAVRETFEMSMTRYYQVLNTLIDRPDAMAAEPATVARLRRLRAARQRQRSARRQD